jgi:hypothetical protein
MIEALTAMLARVWCAVLRMLAVSFRRTKVDSDNVTIHPERSPGMIFDIDVFLDAQRRNDAIRDAARCTSEEEADAVYRRFVISQGDDAPIDRVLLQ